MSPVFTINFRREAYRRELARTRRRLVLLGGWVTYFGILGLILGLYALNCVSLTRRVTRLERQTARLRTVQSTGQEWTLDSTQVAAVEHYQGNPRYWREKLVRLATLLPPHAALTSIAVNPDNLPAESNQLVLVGQLRPAAGQDPMRGVVQLVSSLQRDSTFATGYQNIKLGSSRTSAGPGATTEFVIECR